MESRVVHAQQLSNLIRFGTVAEVDHDSARCRVHSGDLQTDFLQWLVPAAGQTIQWAPPTLGEQVVLLCAEGDLANAVVLRGLYSATFAPPSTLATGTLLRFADGAVVQYDSASHALTATLPAGGAATVSAPAGITLNADVTINGNVTVNGNADATGTVTAAEDVVGGGISLKGHAHRGVVAGSAVSGPPA